MPNNATSTVASWANVLPWGHGFSRKQHNFRLFPALTGGIKKPDLAGDIMNDLLTAVAKRQDQTAFRALFEHFAPRIKAFMKRQGVATDVAEEIVQETMVNVWRKANQFDPSKASSSTWIFTIARNVRIDLLRKQNRPMPDMNDPTMVSDPVVNPHQLISREQEAELLKKNIVCLPAEQREVLHLAFVEDKTHAMIAKQLGIPLGTVKSRIRLAFRFLRAKLGDFE